MPSDGSSRLGGVEIEAHLAQLTKPPGSLGRLEALAARLCAVQGTLKPETGPRRLTIFAGDHGVVAEGVSAWPSEVTGLMIRNIVEGGAASSVMAASAGVELELVDVGSLQDPLPVVAEGSRCRYLDRRVRRGSRNLAQQPALTPNEWRAAFEVGAERARAASTDGCHVVAAGEMGIGNTTPASCLAALLLDLPAVEVCGPGAGSDADGVSRKVLVVEKAVAAARADLETDPEAALAAVAGLEIAAMAGFYAVGASLGLTMILDGFIATAAALAAEQLVPGTSRALIAAHRSAEPAHGAMLERLDLEPFLEWNLRLGEGTGALLLMPLLDAAAAMVGEMATFEQMGIGPGNAEA